MEAIPNMSVERQAHFATIQDNLNKQTVGLSKRELINYVRTPGYAHYRFNGTILPCFVEALGRQPTPDEIIILVDGGFSTFGASCTITGNKFYGRVDTD